MISFFLSERQHYDTFHAFEIIRCLELRQTKFGCLLSWKKAGEFDIEIDIELTLNDAGFFSVKEAGGGAK